ncbi:hypothetical protein L5515_011120 [Caenorhabditis briggsae]|uniref:Uncharacterized protein n=1 Tax=Caenorhabditis briggsae TaxID=6238 RepID=A0AAE9JF17_CAEBR|nr:hypothetical protein L5515_011120 [Caenorhabditis briggsae]
MLLPSTVPTSTSVCSTTPRDVTSSTESKLLRLTSSSARSSRSAPSSRESQCSPPPTDVPSATQTHMSRSTTPLSSTSTHKRSPTSSSSSQETWPTSLEDVTLDVSESSDTVSVSQELLTSSTSRMPLDTPSPLAFPTSSSSEKETRPSSPFHLETEFAFPSLRSVTSALPRSTKLLFFVEKINLLI